MKITGRVEIEAVTDVQCDVCRCSTRLDTGGLQFATLQAHWGFGTKHDGERYELHLCENCFFGTVATEGPDGYQWAVCLLPADAALRLPSNFWNTRLNDTPD